MALIKNFLTLLLLSLTLFSSYSLASASNNELPSNTQVLQTEMSKYPDYAKMYVGEDKYEKFNRKIFNLNSKLNKFVAKPVHILWSSIMPKYGIERIKNAYNNIEYPKRLASCLLQKDGKGAKDETLRFLTNSTLGLGGLFDPAEKLFNIKPTSENMEQALCKCKMDSGTYLVAPILNSCTPRSLCGRALEAALDPSVYLGSPITALIKFGCMVNRTSDIQPLAEMIESTYADPYDIHKKLFGIENYIKNSNLNRVELLANNDNYEEVSAIKEELMKQFVIPEFNIDSYILADNSLTGMAINLDKIEDVGNSEALEIIKKPEIESDIILENYNAQTPVVDSMRTALFDNPEINKSIWNELSIWNRSFAKRVKTGYVSIFPEKEPYRYRYIMQKDKNAPIVILFPSIGEGAKNHHSLIFAKMFYDEGCSVIIQGSHFHWEFVKSMSDNYHPGLPAVDAKNIKLLTKKILDNLEEKYKCNFEKRYIVGTSFGAMATLFIADQENKENTLNINKFIAISPPIELKYALEQLDKNAEVFNNHEPDIKHKTALTAAKVLQLYESKNSPNFKIGQLPFSDEEGKLITTFILRQKLSDLIFTIEKLANNDITNIYEKINNMSYRDYVDNYLLKDSALTLEDISHDTSLFALRDYLQNNDNYIIYHSLDDYFINKNQLERLKIFTGDNLTCLSNGAHLGFLYRDEFITALKNDYIDRTYTIVNH